jgi:hypothetical protein
MPGQAQVPYQVATNTYTPGAINTDSIITQQAVQLLGGGTKAWMYQYLEPANTLAASVDGRASAAAASAALTSGTVYAFAMPIEAGLTISNMSLVSLTAEATGTHAWVGVANNLGKVLGISADNTAAAYFAANTATTTALATPFTTAYTGLYYGFVCVVASGTMPTFAASTAMANAAVSAIAPVYCGTTLTSQTTPVAVGSSLGTITGTAGHALYSYLT